MSIFTCENCELVRVIEIETGQRLCVSKDQASLYCNSQNGKLLEPVIAKRESVAECDNRGRFISNGALVASS